MLACVIARKSADPGRGKRHLVESDFNQVLSLTGPSGTTTFRYDSNGNQTTKTEPTGITTYTWDARDRLTQVNLPGGILDRFGYDAQGLRVDMQDSQGSRRVLVDVGDEVAEYYTSGGIRRARYDHEPRRIDVLLAQVTSVGKNFVLVDALGSVYGLADEGANSIARYSYDVYGARTAVLEAVSTPWGFDSRRHESDVSLVAYHRLRYYDSATGVWSAQDPLPSIALASRLGIRGLGSMESIARTSSAMRGKGAAVGDRELLDLNRYAFVSERPTVFGDPSGLAASCCRDCPGGTWGGVVVYGEAFGGAALGAGGIAVIGNMLCFSNLYVVVPFVSVCAFGGPSSFVAGADVAVGFGFQWCTGITCSDQLQGPSLGGFISIGAGPVNVIGFSEVEHGRGCSGILIGLGGGAGAATGIVGCKTWTFNF